MLTIADHSVYREFIMNHFAMIKYMHTSLAGIKKILGYV